MLMTDELVRWSYEQKCERLVETLGLNGFTAFYCRTRQDAADYILKEAAGARSIGFGGSMSVADLGVQERLREQGKDIINHGMPGFSREEKNVVMRHEQTCDLFLCGTNAVTTSGCLVNIDAYGNRVAAMIFGPQKVIVVAGRNKIVDGDIMAAIRRIKDVAAPPNAKRCDSNTPCAKTGFCSDCNSPDRICRVTTILDRRPKFTEMHVLMVNEELGL